MASENDSRIFYNCLNANFTCDVTYLAFLFSIVSFSLSIHIHIEHLFHRLKEMRKQFILIHLLYLLTYTCSDESTALPKTEEASRRANLSMVPDIDDDDDSVVEKKRIVNFASVTAGAVVLESSPQSVGYNNLLSDDKDKYVNRK